MSSVDRYTRDQRVYETARALTDMGTMNARKVLRERYTWSEATWKRYKSAAIVALGNNRLCAEAERNALIAATENIMCDPAATTNTRGKCVDILAKLKGAYAPTLQDIRSITMELPSNVRALLDAPGALQRAISDDSRFLGLETTNAHPGAS